MKSFAIAITIVGFVMAGCSRTAPSSSPTLVAVPPSPTISSLPVPMLVKQRSTTSIPGSADELSLTVDDITRGQVMVSLIRKGGNALLGPVSMKKSDAATFHFGDKDYSLKLAELSNAVIGEDFASFIISDVSPQPLTETQKIELLISAVESMAGAVFVRNGIEHSAMDAATHLRQKLDAATGKITTASQFIEQVASKSSITGQAYEIRFEDGHTVPASDFLRDELAKLEASR